MAVGQPHTPTLSYQQKWLVRVNMLRFRHRLFFAVRKTRDIVLLLFALPMRKREVDTSNSCERIRSVSVMYVTLGTIMEIKVVVIIFL